MKNNSLTLVNILDSIVEQKRREIGLLPRRRVTSENIRSVLAERPVRRDFLAALKSPGKGKIALIAEVKKASPSAGVICPNFDPVRIAREYEAAGASCLSVLTDEKFFQGSPAYLRDIRAAVNLPLLRKDFILDERQALEAAEWGADAILLIARILDDTTLRHLLEVAEGGGLTVLVEVHDEKEMERALAAGARLIGVNNRDLDTFQVDLGTTGRLAARLTGGQMLVAESGLHTRADVVQVQKAGAGAILVGEALMKNPAGIAAKISELLTGS